MKFILLIPSTMVISWNTSVASGEIDSVGLGMWLKCIYNAMGMWLKCIYNAMGMWLKCIYNAMGMRHNCIIYNVNVMLMYWL